MSSDGVSAGLQKYIKTNKMTDEGSEALRGGSAGAAGADGAAASAATTVNMEDEVHSRTTEGVHVNHQNGAKTWAPKTDAEAQKLSDGMADSATGILAGLKIPGYTPKK